ncbi:histone-lysine N-methyltransferase SUV39H1-like isoform X1 [Schistocerca gregaria]|uniref:histone-lysine N-methyltransferase SUV39H1-like isoform X1 n=1 Tax=Schistocerca gregaria TaxID=7010 RepID=UPI00211F3386|nr:histone-lysine N-methyltransferase SUV39H1-like isoform X1 [Schistocerca gregaria]
MYHRRKRSRQRSLSPAFSFCGAASSTFDASPSLGVGIKATKCGTLQELSTRKFPFTDAAVADVTCTLPSCQESVKNENKRTPPLKNSNGDTSLTLGVNECVSSRAWKKSVVRKRCHSLSCVHENMTLVPQEIDIMEDMCQKQGAVYSFKKEHLLNCFTHSALLAHHDIPQFSLTTGSDDKLITRWDVFSDFPPDNETVLTKDHGDIATPRKTQSAINNVTPKKPNLRKSFKAELGSHDEVGHVQETAQVPLGSSRKRKSQRNSFVNNTVNSVDNDQIKSRRNYSKKKKKVVNLEVDASGVLKKKYEVEKVIDHCTSKNKRYYYVKWKGWSHCYNTWEPEEHLKTCESVIKTYIQFLRERICSGNLFSTQEAKDLQEKLVTITKYELEKLMKLYVKVSGIPYTVCSEEEVVHKMKMVFRPSKEKKGEKNILKVKNDILVRTYDIYRMVQLDALKTWEKELNDKATEKAKIFVENDVDLEGPPSNFTYINDYIPGKGVVIPDDPPIGCTCGPKCDRHSKECCGQQSGSIFAYSHKHLLVADVGVPIYECNKRCKCSQDCPNRVVQKGRKIDLSIFRTSTGCGWGVKTLQRIKKGSFICEYVGEVIETKEAEKRGKIYDAEGRTYLFDLDFNVDACPYTVDAAAYGNVSHFINHSCDPNVAVYAVWVNCLDPNLPKLALFAKNDIKVGDELTFDYMHNNLSIQDDANSTANRVVSSPRSRLLLPNADDSTDLTSYKTPCKCGAKQCKRYLF